MKLIVDLHIHSYFSRATSKEMNIISLYRWGKIKGINIIGTGDFTHPLWFKELSEKLEPAEPGLFKLKEEFASLEDEKLPEILSNNLIRFILTVEISNIYSKNDKVRKLHNLIIAPSFKAAAEVNERLTRIGNLKADGRPILGLDSKELLKISMQSDPENFFIPAHIWTPWFSMFGSKSGFDTIAEAFDELAPEIKAVETGLSSDPFMNWRIQELQNVTLVSNSDAHSPWKLGREANVIESELTYHEIIDAIKTGDERFVGTIEFYPEEGKYHYDGHRACKFKCDPDETKNLEAKCPKCGKPLVVGVQSRVSDLADYPFTYEPKDHKRVEYIIPLPEIIAELKGLKNPQSKTVNTIYEEMYSKLGDEFSILRNVPIEVIRNAGYEAMAEGILKMREGSVTVKPGFDGVYGIIRVFDKGGKERVTGQQRLL